MELIMIVMTVSSFGLTCFTLGYTFGKDIKRMRK